MAEEPARSVPEGAAVFPEIPPELHIDPLLLAVLHAVVFLDGSAAAIVQPEAATEALDHIAGYLQRLGGPQRQRAREDMECVVGHARQQKWPREQVQFLKTFLTTYGPGEPKQP